MTEGGGPLRIHAVVDAAWRGPAGDLLGGGEGASGEEGSVRLGDRTLGFRLLENEETAAAVTDADAAEGREALVLHARVVEALLGSRSVVPVPGWLVARDEAAVRRLLDRARLPLREALDRFEGCYELRLHVARRADRGPEGRPGNDPADEAEASAPAVAGSARERGEDARAAAERLYRKLRFRARSARRLTSGPGRVLTGAFLVPREEWIGFVEDASRVGDRHPELEVDVTGPWAPYDFVRFLREGPP